MQHIKLFENFLENNSIENYFSQEELETIFNHVARINHPGLFNEQEVESYLTDVCNGDMNLCKSLIAYLEKRGLDLDWAIWILKR